MDNKEKYIIDSISNHREAIDTDELWASVADSIPKKEKKRRGIIWFWAGMVSFGLISGLTYSIHTAKFEDPILNETMQTDLPANNIIASHQSDQTNNSPIQKESKSEKSKSLIEEIAQNQSSLENIKSELDPKLDPKRKQQLSTSKNSQTDTSEKHLSNTIVLENINIQRASIKVEERNREIEEELIDKQNGLVPDLQQTGDNEIRSIEVGQLALSDVEHLHYDRAKLDLSIPIIPYVDLTIDRPTHNRWSIFANAGISAVSRQLVTADAEFISVLDRRNQIEQVRGGWQSTIGLEYQISAPISISLGMGIGQIYEQSSFTTQYTIQNEEEQVTSIIYTQDGEVNYLTENVTLFTERNTSEIRQNQFRYYYIPVSLRYRLWENAKSSLSLRGGLGYSFLQIYSGTTSIRSDEESYSLDMDKENLFAGKGAISYGLGIDARRSVNNKLDLVLGLGISRMNRISSISNPIDQKYRTFTFTFGISHTL